MGRLEAALSPVDFVFVFKAGAREKEREERGKRERQFLLSRRLPSLSIFAFSRPKPCGIDALLFELISLAHHIG